MANYTVPLDDFADDGADEYLTVEAFVWYLNLQVNEGFGFAVKDRMVDTSRRLTNSYPVDADHILWYNT